MAKKKQTGGYLKGPSHKNGGIPAIVGGQEPIELEGNEYIIKAPSAKKLGKKTLDEINKTGRIPNMNKGGKVKEYKKGDKVDKAEDSYYDETLDDAINDLPISEKEKERLYQGGKKMTNRKKLLKKLKKEYPGHFTFSQFGTLKSEIAGEAKATKRKSKDSKKKKAKKKQMGGQIDRAYTPTASMPNFPKDVIQRGHGGETVVHSSKKMGAGGPVTTYSHSGYKAGE